MRKLSALGAPFALFGFLFQLLLPVTTAVAHQFDPNIGHIEICTRVGVKQLPSALTDLVAPVAAEPGHADADTPTAKPEYCPGAATAALAPTGAVAPVILPFLGRGAALRSDQAVPPSAAAVPGLGARGPPQGA